MSVAAHLHAAAAAGFGASLCVVEASAVTAFVVESGVGLRFDLVVVHRISSPRSGSAPLSGTIHHIGNDADGHGGVT